MAISSPTTTSSSYPTGRERIVVQLIHWGIVLIVIIAIALLAMLNHLDRASVTALYGAVLGHVGTSASQKLQSRGSDGEG